MYTHRGKMWFQFSKCLRDGKKPICVLLFAFSCCFYVAFFHSFLLVSIILFVSMYLHKKCKYECKFTRMNIFSSSIQFLCIVFLIVNRYLKLILFFRFPTAIIYISFSSLALAFQFIQHSSNLNYYNGIIY